MDLSFISVLKVLPALADLIGTGKLIVLIKPQFEARKGQVGNKGVVRDPSLHLEVLNRVIADAESLGFGLAGVMRSPLSGQKGNREFLVLWELGSPWLAPQQKESQIKEAVWDENN
jgi:23S rRNA (cytidine1920-2'-O)/16S rRNA (cytidine1409-2'-O)-methyltransferase